MPLGTTQLSPERGCLHQECIGQADSRVDTWNCFVSGNIRVIASRRLAFAPACCGAHCPRAHCKAALPCHLNSTQEPNHHLTGQGQARAVTLCDTCSTTAACTSTIAVQLLCGAALMKPTLHSHLGGPNTPTGQSCAAGGAWSRAHLCRAYRRSLGWKRPSFPYTWDSDLGRHQSRSQQRDPKLR